MISNGTAVSSKSIKSFQLINESKFKRKWFVRCNKSVDSGVGGSWKYLPKMSTKHIFLFLICSLQSFLSSQNHRHCALEFPLKNSDYYSSTLDSSSWQTVQKHSFYSENNHALGVLLLYLFIFNVNTYSNVFGLWLPEWIVHIKWPWVHCIVKSCI